MIGVRRLIQVAKTGWKKISATYRGNRKPGGERKLAFRRLGIGRSELSRLKKLPERYATTTSILGKKISISSPFWYLHGLEELFVEETYRFVAAVNNPKIIDCGANIGLSTIYFKRLFPDASITAFEPDPAIFELLQQNIAAFKFSGVTLENKAVWTENTVLQFHADGAVGGSIRTRDHQAGTEQPVKAVRLRDLLDEQVDFLKIDIEGPEDLILRDCADRLQHVENIFIEYHSFHQKPQSLQEILEILSSNGFRYYIKEAWQNMHHPFLQKKGLFYDLQLNIFGYRIAATPTPVH